MLGCARLPLLDRAGHVDVGLAVAGRERGDAGGVVAAGCLCLHVLLDLQPASRELAQHPGRDALDFGHALDRVAPVDAEPGGELVAEVGLVEVAAGEPVGLQERLAVECAPLAVGGGAGHVGDDHVRVQLRVLGAACAVLVGGGDEPFRVFALDAVSSLAHDAGLVLEIGERGLPGGEVGLVDLVADVLVAERVQEADALGGAEDEVVAADRREPLRLQPARPRVRVDPLDRDRPLPGGPAEPLAARGVEALAELAELPVCDDAAQPERGGAAAGPDPG